MKTKNKYDIYHLLGLFLWILHLKIICHTGARLHRVPLKLENTSKRLQRGD